MGKQGYYVSLPLQILQNDFPTSGRRFSSSQTRAELGAGSGLEGAWEESSKGTEVSSHTRGPELAWLALAGSYISTLFQKVSWEHSTPRDARPEPRKAVPGHTCPPGLQGIAVQGHPCPICPWILPVHACRTVLRLQERGAAGACGQEGTRPPVGTWGWWPLRALT